MAIIGKKIAVSSGHEQPFKEGKESIDPNFKLQKYHITVQTQSIVEIAYSTLNEMNPTPCPENMEYLHTARDVFDLFRSLVTFENSCSMLT